MKTKKGVPVVDISRLPMEKILPPKTPSRSAVGPVTLDSLTESIRIVGMLNPIAVVQEGGHYRILAGARRYAAAKSLGWQTIAVRIFTDTGTNMELIQLHENLEREAVRPTDEARWLQRTMSRRKWNGRQLAAALGQSEAWVSERLALLSLPTDLTDRVDAGEIPFSAARELGRVKDPSKRAQLIHYAVASGVDTRTAARWREDADSGAADLAAGPTPMDASGQPVPLKMMRECEVCKQAHEITTTRVLHLCPGCYTSLTEPPPG